MGKPRSPQGRAREANRRLTEEYPDVACALDHRDAFELLVATILSAQCTDKRVNMVTPVLFGRFGTAEELAAAPLSEVEEIIHSTGFYQNKARNIVAMAQRLVEMHEGEVPTSMDDLKNLPGVGRKTANVVRSVAFELPGLPVDTHVSRLSQRMGMTEETDPVKIEMALNPMVPAKERGDFSLRLILHGRQICHARKPTCVRCVCQDFCLSAFKFEPVAKAASVKATSAKASGAKAALAKASAKKAPA